MLTISKPLAVEQANEYYKNEYMDPSQSHSAGHEGVMGNWFGHIAARWELYGAVTKDQYERLCNGQHPSTGEQLVRHVKPKTYMNNYGKEVTASAHRTGWDATFSAPKTVSLAAVFDPRLREAHQECVDISLSELQLYTQARIGRHQPSQTTGKMIAARFEHDTARPDRVHGYTAPQLHTHGLIFNLTITDDGITKAVQPLELYKSQQYVTAIYRAALAERLQGLGYEVEVDERTGAPEIKGFSREYITASSPRRKEVERKAREIKERLEAGGAVVKEGPGLYHAAAHMDRSGKQYDRDLVRERHREMDAQYGHQAQNSMAKARERGSIIQVEKDVAEHARSAVDFALNKAAEQGKALDIREVMTHALRHGLGRTTYGAVYGEFAVIRERGGFIDRTREPKRQQRDASREQKQSIKPSLLKKDESREPNSYTSAKMLSARSLIETVERLQSDGAVIEIIDQIQRLNMVAQEQDIRSKRTLIISPSQYERATLNSLVRRELQAAGNISQRENLTKVLVNRSEASGAKRSLASSYYPDKDIIKFNRTSKIYGIKAGDEGRVVASDHELNTITVAFADGRTVTYNPA
jgi:conjugative relaxase-like TrwC/TraI family protein